MPVRSTLQIGILLAVAIGLSVAVVFTRRGWSGDSNEHSTPRLIKLLKTTLEEQHAHSELMHERLDKQSGRATASQWLQIQDDLQAIEKQHKRLDEQSKRLQARLDEQSKGLQAIKKRNCLVLATTVFHCSEDLAVRAKGKQNVETTKTRFSHYAKAMLFWTKQPNLDVFIQDSSGFDWGVRFNLSDASKNTSDMPHVHLHRYKQKCPISSSSRGEAAALQRLVDAEPLLQKDKTMCKHVIKITPRYRINLPALYDSQPLHLQWRSQHHKDIKFQPSEFWIVRGSLAQEVIYYLHDQVFQKNQLMERGLWAAGEHFGATTFTHQLPLLEPTNRGGDNMMMEKLR